MLDLVGNPEDRFSQNEAHIGSWGKVNTLKVLLLSLIFQKDSFAYNKHRLKRILIALSLLLYLYCYARKKEGTDPGAPPWTMDRVDSELAKRLSGNLTMISHVTAHTCQTS